MTEEKNKIYDAQMIAQTESEIVATKDFTAPEDLYRQLIGKIKKYHPSTDISQIEKAYHIARDAHEGQMRKSGEPYIIHPFVWRLFWQIWSLIRRQSSAGFFMMLWKTR